MIDFIKANQKNIEKICIVFLFLAGLFLFFEFLFPFIAPFFFGWILSLLFHPLVTFLNKKWKLPRSIGSLFSILLLLGFLSSVVAGSVYRIAEEAKLFYAQLPSYMALVQNLISQVHLWIQNSLELLPDNIQLFFQEQSNDFWSILTSILTTGKGNGGLNWMLAIPNTLMVWLVSLLASFFFTKDHEEIYSFVGRHVPPKIKNTYCTLRQNMGEAFLGYVKTQFILMIITFFICLIGLFLLKSPYSLLLSVIISIIDALPFFGSGFILWPMAFIQLLTGDLFLALGYLILYLSATLLRQILQPKVLGTQIGLPPLVTLFSMYIGLKAMGVLGMIVGPILAVLIKAGFQIHTQTKESQL